VCNPRSIGQAENTVYQPILGSLSRALLMVPIQTELRHSGQGEKERKQFNLLVSARLAFAAPLHPRFVSASCPRGSWRGHSMGTRLFCVSKTCIGRHALHRALHRRRRSTWPRPPILLGRRNDLAQRLRLTRAQRLSCLVVGSFYEAALEPASLISPSLEPQGVAQLSLSPGLRTRRGVPC
jgi:hypothetical protein